MWFKLFGRRKEGSAQPQGPLGDPRRRRHARHPCRVQLVARCSSWDSFHDLFAGNISKGGLYIPSTTPAQIGDSIDVQLTTPDGEKLQLSGNVVHVFGDDAGTQQGLGVHLERLRGQKRRRFRELVDQAARQVEVRPARQELVEVRPARQELEDSLEISIDVEPVAVAEAAAPATPPVRARPPASPGHKAPLSLSVGIDFGTTRSSVALVQGQEVQVLRSKEGLHDLPSVVGFLEDHSVVVGVPAQELRGVDPHNVISSPKRLLGRLQEDREIEPHLASLTMSTSADRQGEVLVHAQGKTYTIPQVCAPFIYSLRLLAEAQLGREVTRAVLTVPVTFDERRGRALRRAAGMAGIKEVDLVDEPTAAALAQRFDDEFRGLVAVYDFGGGTFDFSVVDATSADLPVVATAGDIWLGGDDFDEALAGAAANAFWRQHGIELRHNVVQWQRLLLAAEQAKRQLSMRTETVVRVERAALRPGGALDLCFPVTREEFCRITAPIVERSIDTCREALSLSQIEIGELNAVYLSGGTSYVPAVREAVARFFGMPPRVVVPPERAVVIGAAMYGAREQTRCLASA